MPVRRSYTLLLRWGTAALEIMILVVPLVLLRMLEVECRLRLGQALFDPAYGGFFYSLIVLCLSLTCTSACLYLLQMRPLGKFLLLMTLCLPVLLLLIKLLVLSFGQSISL